MRRFCWTLVETLAEAEEETLGHTLGDAQALVDTLADMVANVETETLGDTLSDAQSMVDTMADSQAKVEAETLSDKLVDTLADLRKHSSTRLLNIKQR